MTFERQIATTLRLIAKYGADCTWQKIVLPDDDDPADPSAGTPEHYPVKILFLPTNELSLRSTLSMIVGTEVPSGRLMGYMGAVEFQPEMSDTVLGTPFGDLGIIDNNGIDRLAPNGETILYTLRFVR